MSLLHRWIGILAHSSLQNCFNSAILEGFLAWTARLRSHHSISIGFKSGLWLGYSEILILFSLGHSEVDLLVCFGLLSCCMIQERLSWENTDTTEIIVFGPKKQRESVISRLESLSLKPKNQVRNWGVILDSHLNLNRNIKSITSAAFYV